MNLDTVTNEQNSIGVSFFLRERGEAVALIESRNTSSYIKVLSSIKSVGTSKVF